MEGTHMLLRGNVYIERGKNWGLMGKVSYSAGYGILGQGCALSKSSEVLYSILFRPLRSKKDPFLMDKCVSFPLVQPQCERHSTHAVSAVAI